MLTLGGSAQLPSEPINPSERLLGAIIFCVISVQPEKTWGGSQEDGATRGGGVAGLKEPLSTSGCREKLLEVGGCLAWAESYLFAVMQTTEWDASAKIPIVSQLHVVPFSSEQTNIHIQQWHISSEANRSTVDQCCQQVGMALINVLII